MKCLAGMPLILGALALGFDDCDVKKVSSGLYCDGCSNVLSKETLVGGKYCKACNEGKEGKDRIEAKKVKVCIKSTFGCEEHDTVKEPKGGKCPECKKSLKEIVDAALVTFACSGCGAEGPGPGACKNKDCKKEKHKFVGKCAKSGTFPHVGGK